LEIKAIFRSIPGVPQRGLDLASGAWEKLRSVHDLEGTVGIVRKGCSVKGGQRRFSGQVPASSKIWRPDIGGKKRHLPEWLQGESQPGLRGGGGPTHVEASARHVPDRGTTKLQLKPGTNPMDLTRKMVGYSVRGANSKSGKGSEVESPPQKQVALRS